MMLNKILAERAHRRMPAQVEIVRVEPFDFGNFLGVAIELSEPKFVKDATGRPRHVTRHAVRVKIDDGDLTKAADEAAEALNDWLAN